MLSSETISCILEGIYLRSDCGMDLALEKVTAFFDIYEKEVHNKIIQDPDYIKLQKDFPDILIDGVNGNKEAVLYWWASSSYTGTTDIYLRDNKNRSFIDPIRILDPNAYGRNEIICEFKRTMPKAFKRLDKLGKEIIQIVTKRTKLKNKFNYDLQQSIITLDSLQEEYPLLYQLYEEGKKYRSK